MRRIIALCSVLFLLPSLAEKESFGWLEYVYIGKGEYRIKAKLDSGAKTSSIHVLEKTLIESSSGKDLIKFKIEGYVPKEDKQILKTVNFTRPIDREVKIKSSNGDIETRYVVTLPIRIGEKNIEAEFTLSDRTRMNYRVLLGRSTISQLGYIDCGEVFLQKKKHKASENSL